MNLKRKSQIYILILLPVILLHIVLADGENCTKQQYLPRGMTTEEFSVLKILHVNSTPASEQVGTIFTIRAAVQDAVNIQPLVAKIRLNGNLVETIYLFDDGMHGDSAKDDYNFANTWDSTGKASGVYDIDITATNVIGQTAHGYANGAINLLDSKCVPIRYSGQSKDKLDIVFVPCDYGASEGDKFRTDAIAHMNMLLGFSPFNEYNNRTNVFIVNRPGALSCYYSGRCVLAPSSQVYSLAGECKGYDKIIVLAKSTAWAGCAYLGGISHASSSYPWISVHEFGHGYGMLLDEYSYGSSGGTSGPNCDYAGCARWNGLPGTGCFPG